MDGEVLGKVRERRRKGGEFRGRRRRKKAGRDGRGG